MRRNCVTRVLLFGLCGSGAAFAQTEIPRHVIGAGGGEAASVHYTARTTIGQPIADRTNRLERIERMLAQSNDASSREKHDAK